MGTIRFLLALSVVANHSAIFPLTGNQLAGGPIAVQGFFMISGFYMALVLTTKYTDRTTFYFNRALRLYPTYLAMLAVTVAIHIAIAKPTVFEAIFASPLLEWDGLLLMLIANLAIIGSDLMMFVFPSADGLQFTWNFAAHPDRMLYRLHAIPQAWSLPIEMMFYAIAPFVVRRKRSLVALLLLSLAIRIVLYRAGATGDPWTYRFFPSELAFFCVGALAYHLYGWARRHLDDGRMFEIGTVLWLVVVLHITHFSRIPVLPGTNFHFAGSLQFYALLFASLPFIFSATSRIRWDRAIGELSYPLYISHWVFARNLGDLPILFGQAAIDTMIYSIAAAIVLHLGVQLPVERAFKRPGSGEGAPSILETRATG